MKQGSRRPLWGKGKYLNSFSGRFELTRTKNSHRAPSISSRMQNFSPKGHLVLTTRLKTTYYGDKLTFSSPEPLGFISNTKCPIKAAGSKRGVYLGGVVSSAPQMWVALHCCWFSHLLREAFLRWLRFSPLPKNQHLILIWSGTYGHIRKIHQEIE